MRSRLALLVFLLAGCGAETTTTSEPADEPAPTSGESAGAPAALPASIHLEIELPGPAAGRWMNVTVTPGSLPWTITGCTGPGRAPCEETSRVELDEAARTELVTAIAAVRAIPRCEPDGIFPNERPYELTMVGAATPYAGTMPIDVTAIDARTTGECRADARLAWWIARHFEPSVALPVPLEADS